MNEIAQDILIHYGVKRRSGRYPWGSGEDPYQHSGDLLSRNKDLQKQGLKETEIAKAMGFDSTKDLREALRDARHERDRLNRDRAQSLKDDGLNTSQIAREMGVNESTVRSWFNENREVNQRRAEKAANYLREELKTKHALDVGAGVETELGISRGKLDDAIRILEAEGYIKEGIGVPQVGNPKHRTTVQVLHDDTLKTRDFYADPEKIKNVGEFASKDGGEKWYKRERPASIDSGRVQIKYGDEGGADKDGVIEIRRGVKDLDLGNAHYAQVRIMVDGTHYLKGMAMYSDDIPDGVDIVFNTNKKSGTPKMKVLKECSDDPDNPFGAYIKADGQSYYDDPNGTYINPITGNKAKLSAINKLKEEGDWDRSSKNLSSQFLSKQPIQLIRQQLSLTYADYDADYDEIMSIPNPVVRKKMLNEFAGKCDSATEHLKAAALPRQQTRVILPITQLKDNEVYAPYLRDGETVALVRYPHGGTFEIPVLKVNNRNTSAKRILGNATDAVGINSKVAERLSGADFDGDTVIVIPTNSRVHITSRAPLKDLVGFDPKSTYAVPESNPNKVPLLDKARTQNEMGVISNLITDMTLRGADDNELARAVKHSMVVIDAAKHKLDYKQSEKDNGIAELKKKYQPKFDENGNPTGKYGGASTLLSRRKQTTRVPERRGSGRVDKETGEIIYKESGRTYRNKKGQEVRAMNEVPLISTVDDMRKLSSGTIQENAYAAYGNKMKALAKKARKEAANTEGLKYSATAKKVYATEVKQLDDALIIAKKNQPRERRAQAIANSVVKAKQEAYPELKDKENKKLLAKIRTAAVEDARAAVGASGRDTRISITPKQWEAIQAGAITSTKLNEILKYTKDEELKELALPRQKTTISTAKQNKITQMHNSGFTIAEIADQIGVSTSTVSKYLRSSS